MLEIIFQRIVVTLLLRLGLAVVFVYHGLQLINADTGWGTAWNPDLPPWQQMLVAYGELIGGIAVAFGFLTRLAALGLAVIMMGAIITVHWPTFDITAGGFEYNFILIIVCLALIILGGGVLSLDRLIFGRRRYTLRERVLGR